jgi:hypothetical protein
MKTLNRITLLIALIALFSSCQSSTDVSKILANQDTKNAIMDTIANDSNLSVEMMDAIMNSENSNAIMGNEKMTTMMMQNQGTMLKMMQNNPAMMQSMMHGMMETFKGDTAMMSSMSSIISKYPQMMDMINKNMSSKGMNNMEGMNHNMN